MFSSSATQSSSNLGVEQVFNAYTYTGLGASPTSITTPLVFTNATPFEWMKNRNQVTQPHTFGQLGSYLYTNSTNFSFSTPNYISSFLASSIGFGSNQSYINGDNYTIYSNLVTRKFFDKTSWTGTGGSRIIPHNLGSAPGFVIVKSTSGSVSSWYVWHTSLSFAGTSTINLNDTSASAVTNMFSIAPTSTSLYMGASTGNDVGVTYDCWMWANDAGGFGFDGSQNIVSCGSYTGNGSTTTGLNVSVGYEPQWILVRNTTGGNWFLVDKTRGASEVQSYLSVVNSNAADSLSSSASIFTTSNGFKVTNNASWLVNENAQPYIYVTIRRGPMFPPSDPTQVFATVLSSAPTGTTMTVGFQPDMQISRLYGTTANTYVIDANRGAIETLGSTYAGSNAVFTNLDSANTSVMLTNKWQPTTQAVPSVYNSAAAVYWNFKRAPRFFDLVRYTGQNGGAINHSLGYTPEMIMVKRVSTAAEWGIYHYAVGATKSMDLTGNPATAASYIYWQNTGPTPTQFYTGFAASTGALGSEYVAYLFATTPGVSKVGAYTGSRTSDTVVDCGFGSRPARFVLIKSIDFPGDWYIWDSSFNATYALKLNLIQPLTSYDYLTLTPGGFTVNTYTANTINIPGYSYLFYAIA